MTENELAVTSNNSPSAMMIAAMDKGVDLEKLEKFMELQARYEANQARKAYFEAITAFHANPPEIDKNKHVKYTTKAGSTTDYHHANLFNVTEKINAALTQHGLHASWTTTQVDKQISVTCKISHVMGHSESTTLSSGPDDSGGKNSIQAIGSAVTYLQRYTLLSLTGLATKEMDNDGQGEVAYITDQQKSTIVDMINAKGVKEDKFLEFLECESLEKIPANKFNSAMTALRAKKDK